jgi:protein TonB
MAKMEMPVPKVFKPLVIKDIIDPPPPPKIEPVPPKEMPKQNSRIDQVPALVQTPRKSDVVLDQPKMVDIPVFNLDPPGKADVVPQPEPKIVPEPDPVRVEAQMDRRSELQPPYPASEERAEREGSVTVRLTIGPDGRVKAAEKVRATSDAFFTATQRHALRSWRFKPATVDGKPVESVKVMTVHFRLED